MTRREEAKGVDQEEPFKFLIYPLVPIFCHNNTLFEISQRPQDNELAYHSRRTQFLELGPCQILTL